MNRLNVTLFRTIAALGCWGALVLSGHGAGFEALVHHWSFDEGPDWHDDPFQAVGTATVAKDRVGGVDAAFQGMDASAWVSGRQYTGLAFDGTDDALQLGADLGATLGGTASLSLWLHTDQTGAATSDAAPGIAGSAGVQWGWLDEQGRIVLSTQGSPAARSAVAVNDGAWHHVVLTRDEVSGAVQVYLDGALSTSGTGTTGALAGSVTRIGFMENGSPARFQGRLDQVHVFSGVVDAATVQTLFDNHAPKTWKVSSDGESGAPFQTDSVLVGTYAYDAEQDTLAVAAFTQPGHGSVTHNGDGSFTCTATGGYVGPDAFTVTITDGRGGFTDNTVDLWIAGPAAPGSENRTTTFTDLQALEAGGSPIGLSGWRVPRAVDWDGDGDQDLLIGDDTGIWRYRNSGTTNAPVFDAGVRVPAAGVNISLSGNILIALADMTGDGVDDLVAVAGDRRVRVYRNAAAAGAPPVYAAASLAASTAGGSFVLPDQRFDAADWDGDGLVDLVMGSWASEVRVYLNVGTASSARFDPSGYEVLESGAYNLFPRVFDLNLNGVPDYVRGINWGSINFWFDPSRLDGLGNQSGALTVTYAGGAAPDLHQLTDGSMVDFGDFNGDGVLDLLLGGHAGSSTYLAYGVANTVADSLAALEAIYDAHPTGLGAALEANGQALLNEIKAAEANIVMHMQAASLSERQAQFAQVVAHVGAYPFLQMGAPLDTVEYRHVPSIAGQNLMTLHEMLPDTPGHRTTVANAVGLAGTHREVYLQMGLHVGDNQRAPAGQIEAVRDFMALQPRESFPDAAITLDHYYGDGRGGWVSSFRGAKNTFNFGEGGNSTEWAGDLNAAAVAFYGLEVQRGDYFTFVMGHEVTHSLDGYVRGRANKDLWRRKGQMLTLAAGPDVLSASSDDHDFWDWNVTKARFQAEGHWDGNSATWDDAWSDYWSTGPGAAFQDLSFMRGNIDWFLGASQEAMATQANHHWAHAEARLIGAIDRYQRGAAQGIEPMKANITEVLTFLDWISCGMNKIVMQDTEGVSSPYPRAAFHTTHAWVERNDKGYITRLTTGGRTYKFELDAYGVVTGLVQAPALQRPDEVVVIRNTPNLIRPLANDQANGGALSLHAFTEPAHGSLTDEGDGTLVYRPDPGYTGTDSFSYTSGPGTPSSTVSILVSVPSSAQSGVRMETWNGISGNAVSDLTSDPDFPHNPDASAVRSSFEAPSNRSSNFGTRMTALLTPPTTGVYTFWIASDDQGELWLGGDRSAGSKALIASVPTYVNSPRQWDKYASQQSDPVTLQAGTPYYIEALQKEGGGGDNLAVAWQGPGIAQQVIPGTYLQTVDLNPPAVANPVAEVTVVENAPDTVLDLSAVFSDPDLGDGLQLEVLDVDNPSLVGTSLVGNQLTLSYASSMYGGAVVTLRAADRGGALATNGFSVTVQIDTDGDDDPDVSDPDDDGDGMDDEWETGHGLDPLIDDAAGNPDGDGHDNGQEYLADTDPNDPLSRLACTVTILPDGSTRSVRFPSSADRVYTVEYHDDLGQGSWQTFEPAFLGPGGEATVSDADAVPYRNYRVSAALP